MKQLKNDSTLVWQSLGKTNYGATNNEKAYLKFKRSIYVTKNLKKGDIFTKKNIKVIRPNKGLRPKFYENLLGKKSSKKY